MKLNRKICILLIFLGIPFAFPIKINYKVTQINLDNRDLQNSKISSPILINDVSPSSNWSVAKAAGICTGNGTYSEPYVIEDLIIDGGGSGSCIYILNSKVYFRVENCTVYNAGDEISYSIDAGIRFKGVSNGTLIINDCSSNPVIGIYLEDCYNNTLSGNIVNSNSLGYGIYLDNSHNNTLLGNTANYNGDIGIYLGGSDNNTISGNIVNDNDRDGILLGGSYNTVSGNLMNECGLRISRSLDSLTSNEIDVTNLVNGKPLYYYINQVDLGPNNFTNAGQVLLVNCNDTIVSNLAISFASNAISLYYCNNNTISGNTVNDNKRDGLYLYKCDSNIISGNNANNNNFNGISGEGDNNTISGNIVENNIYDGISIGGSYNNILGNAANYNGDDGISIGYPITGGFRSGGKYNIIIGNTASHNGDSGIYLYGEWPYSSGYCTVSGNIANYNSIGIKLWRYNYNVISGNTLIGNFECIVEIDCQFNEFSDNGDCTYGQGDGETTPSPLISGYNIFLLLSILSVVSIIISKKMKKS